MISNLDSSFSAPMNSFVVPTVTNIMPMQRIDITQVRITQNISLADDPEFYKPWKNDFLIGTETFFSTVQNNTVNLTDSLILKEIAFGYIRSLSRFFT